MSVMPGADKSSYFYGANGERIPLVQDPSVVAVKFRPGHFSNSSSLSPWAQNAFKASAMHVDFIATYGVQIYQQQGSQTLPTPVLAREAAIEYVSPSYKHVGGADTMFATNQLLVQFKPEVSRDEITGLNSQFHVTSVEPLPYAPNGFLLQVDASQTLSTVALANLYYESGRTIFAEPNFLVKRHFRQAVAAPVAPVVVRGVATTPMESGMYLPQQWHLRTAQVVAAWELPGLAYPQGDPGITIAILDDGVDMSHPEFAFAPPNNPAKLAAHYDFSSSTQDGSPRTPDDNHGTACAGVATARGVNAYGAAPTCRLMVARTPDYLGVADEARMFLWACDNGADIISCSWGPQDGVGAVQPLSAATDAAIKHCLTEGRKKKGMPIFWAAGNGNESLDKDGKPRDGYAANPSVMAIAASTSTDARAYYSDFGPEICVCAPSSGDDRIGEKWIFTVDRQGPEGYNKMDPAKGDAKGDYTNDFGGTSSSAPLVAGIAALVLSANPDLRYDQVRDILQRTADRIGAASDYDARGHSDRYGYGRVNARAAVAMALQMKTGIAPAPARPSVKGPITLSRSAARPQFTVDPSPYQYYVFEITSRPELFDRAAHGAERNDTNFYGSYSDNPRFPASQTTYLLPDPVWNKLKAADRLYYRIFSSPGPSGWNPYMVSTSDREATQAPSVQITADVSPAVGGPSVKGPASFSRTSVKGPQFTVDPSPYQYYVFEITSRPELFDRSTRGADRSDTNFYGSYFDNPRFPASQSTYSLPDAVWSKLGMADRLYYRIFSAGRSGWNPYAVSTTDAKAAQAPFFDVTGDVALRDGATVSFPSGAVFASVKTPDDGHDYSDPSAGGTVPLMDCADRGDEYLTRNFRVQEFMSKDHLSYARISPDLVTALQSIRDRLDSPLVITCAYTDPAHDPEAISGPSRHVAGQAADVKSGGKTPIELARIVLEALGDSVGLGLGKDFLHLDVGRLETWVFPGADLDAGAFMAWAQGILGKR